MNLRELKLHKTSKVELQNREMNRLLGGENCCICACQYASEGISTLDNGNNNHSGGSSGLISYCPDLGWLPGYGSGSFG